MTNGGSPASPDRLDAWLNSSGFVDVELDSWATGTIDESDLDDPWADAMADAPTLTDAQRSFLLGDIVSTTVDAPTPDDLAQANDAIIDIPADPDDITPFDT